MMESSASTIPVTPLRDEEGDAVCPPAPRRRARSPSEEVEAAAYDAVVRQLVGELTTRLDALPAVEGLVSPSGLQRQQAFDPAAPRICSPVMMESPAALYVVGAGRQVSAEMDLAAAAAESPLKRRDTDIESSLLEGCYGLASGAAEAESDMSVAATSADTNTCELPATSEGDEESESESESDSEGEELMTGDEAEDSDGTETNTEDAIHHVEAAEDTNTSGLYLSFHRQKGSGELAVRLEAPVWMVGVLMSVVTAYMWMVVYLIKRG